MRVKMLRLMCSPEHGNHDAGDEVDLPEQEAARRIAAGDCVAADAADKPRLRDKLRGRRGGKEPEQADKPLAKQTVAQLQAYAAEHDVDLAGATTKADILAAIEAAQDDDEDG
ncbi:hypothetical protein [Streptomyces phytophilus]|uniref:hypothetical protein n=1 Tax=Streptomyces phytophilus TaxID=722715 RepID=UPI0015F03107|nr:hypothetical protein [Streptomyces phytophilus]